MRTSVSVPNSLASAKPADLSVVPSRVFQTAEPDDDELLSDEYPSQFSLDRKQPSERSLLIDINGVIEDETADADNDEDDDDDEHADENDEDEEEEEDESDAADGDADDDDEDDQAGLQSDSDEIIWLDSDESLSEDHRPSSSSNHNRTMRNRNNHLSSAGGDGCSSLRPSSSITSIRESMSKRTVSGETISLKAPLSGDEDSSLDSGDLSRRMRRKSDSNSGGSSSSSSTSLSTAAKKRRNHISVKTSNSSLSRHSGSKRDGSSQRGSIGPSAAGGSGTGGGVGSGNRSGSRNKSRKSGSGSGSGSNNRGRTHRRVPKSCVCGCNSRVSVVMISLSDMLLALVLLFFSQASLALIVSAIHLAFGMIGALSTEFLHKQLCLLYFAYKIFNVTVLIFVLYAAFEQGESVWLALMNVLDTQQICSLYFRSEDDSDSHSDSFDTMENYDSLRCQSSLRTSFIAVSAVLGLLNIYFCSQIYSFYMDIKLFRRRHQMDGDTKGGKSMTIGGNKIKAKEFTRLRTSFQCPKCGKSHSVASHSSHKMHCEQGSNGVGGGGGSSKKRGGSSSSSAKKAGGKKKSRRAMIDFHSKNRRKWLGFAEQWESNDSYAPLLTHSAESTDQIKMDDYLEFQTQLLRERRNRRRRMPDRWDHLNEDSDWKYADFTSMSDMESDAPTRDRRRRVRAKHRDNGGRRHSYQSMMTVRPISAAASSMAAKIGTVLNNFGGGGGRRSSFELSGDPSRSKGSMSSTTTTTTTSVRSEGMDLKSEELSPIPQIPTIDETKAISMVEFGELLTMQRLKGGGMSSMNNAYRRRSQPQRYSHRTQMIRPTRNTRRDFIVDMSSESECEHVRMLRPAASERKRLRRKRRLLLHTQSLARRASEKPLQSSLLLTRQNSQSKTLSSDGNSPVTGLGSAPSDNGSISQGASSLRSMKKSRSTPSIQSLKRSSHSTLPSPKDRADSAMNSSFSSTVSEYYTRMHPGYSQTSQCPSSLNLSLSLQPVQSVPFEPAVPVKQVRRRGLDKRVLMKQSGQDCADDSPFQLNEDSMDDNDLIMTIPLKKKKGSRKGRR